jgi:two-component system, OmpR family, KDP operon response regulator KdpE
MNNDGIKVLIVDDELQIIKMLSVALEAFGYQVEGALTAKEGIHKISTCHPEIVLLDLSLPDMDGKDVVGHIREWSSIPIIILSARDNETEKISALDAGADDYVTKPFNMGELLARMRVAVRHMNKDDNSNKFVCENLQIDFLMRAVTVNGDDVKLTPTEYDILKLLADNQGKVVTHSQILKAVWGYVNLKEKHYVRIYISQLRQKIENDPSKPRKLVTESGIGYRLVCGKSTKQHI